MCKIGYSLGLAVLGIALLVGSAVAAMTQDVVVGGCFLDSDLELFTTNLNSAVILPLMVATTSTNTVQVSGGSFEVLASEAYDVTVKDKGLLGTLVSGTDSMSNALRVSDGTTDFAVPAAAEGVKIVTGASATDNCSPRGTTITYKQDIVPGDSASKSGVYSIALRYTLAPVT